ncbi:SDR family oxidoreductase [Streptomyces griseocarneus]|uniref:SDR family oxidoreductase n=1 Tax=Streptomyces griseocarneus TaxID=51201 RepID=UPI00167D3501|nr:NAD(P)H-binding protein [Streptomyces griseocarneus]MBZ6477952.1 NAD(P)H-binding protein [Streptomyces griseocarneus]GHG54454.1 nucleotide-diphosphate-sugar epimerase [Streptomyces griseocarneus]
MDSRPILVTGGTGTLGRAVVARFLADGVPVRVMSRRARRAEDDRPYEWAVCDLADGTGLDDALADVRAVVHCATNSRNDVATTRRLVEAARRSGVPHVVYISIVGIDRVPLPYYRAKLEAERIIRESGLPCSILRTTQFHDLVATVVRVQRRLPVVLTPRGVRCQPIEVTEVADRLVELAQGAPAGRVADMAGPEVRDFRDLAEATLRAAGLRRRVVSVALPGKIFRKMRAGGLLAPDRTVGTRTFEEYLAARARAGRS